MAKMSTGLSMDFRLMPVTSLSSTDLSRILKRVESAGKKMPGSRASEEVGEEGEAESEQELDEEDEVPEEEEETDKDDEEHSDSEQEVGSDEDDYVAASASSNKRKLVEKQRVSGGRNYVKVEAPLSKRWPAKRIQHFDVRVEPFVMDKVEESKQALYDALKESCASLIVVADKHHKKNVTAEDE